MRRPLLLTLLALAPTLCGCVRIGLLPVEERIHTHDRVLSHDLESPPEGERIEARWWVEGDQLVGRVTRVQMCRPARVVRVDRSETRERAASIPGLFNFFAYSEAFFAAFGIPLGTLFLLSPPNDSETGQPQDLAVVGAVFLLGGAASLAILVDDSTAIIDTRDNLGIQTLRHPSPPQPCSDPAPANVAILLRWSDGPTETLTSDSQGMVRASLKPQRGRRHPDLEILADGQPLQRLSGTLLETLARSSARPNARKP